MLEVLGNEQWSKQSWHLLFNLSEKKVRESPKESDMSTGGKGSRPRPFSVSQKEFDNRWDAIFKKEKDTTAKEFDDKVVMKEEFYDVDDPDRIGN